MELSKAKKRSPIWIWAIVIFLILLCCCCAAIGGGILYLRSQGQTMQDAFSEVVENPEIQAEPIVTTIPPLEPTQPMPQVVPDNSQNAISADRILVTTSLGIWSVDEASQESFQLSNHPLDASQDVKEGMSPDKQVFAYITGFGGASSNPMLIVLDLERQVSILQLELTGALSQLGMESGVGDKAFEAMQAMQFSDSLAWSPDGQQLVFVAARDGDSADVYLFSRSDNAITRLTDEASNAASLHWSPDGQFLEYMSVDSFGTGAGFGMDALWVYDFSSKKPQLLETLESNGEEFLVWVDDNRFLINSVSRTCGGDYRLRIVDVIRFDGQVIVEGGFTAVAYDTDNKFGMFSVAYGYENCGSGDPLDIGLYIFGESVPVLGADGPIIGEMGRKKFEQVVAYDIGFIPQGNLFTIFGDEGLQNIYHNNGYGLNVLPEIKGLKPYPAPSGDYWAWASYFSGKGGLWVTENNTNPVQLSPLYTGTPVWSLDGQTIYFIEHDVLFLASAPQFQVEQLLEVPGAKLLEIVK